MRGRSKPPSMPLAERCIFPQFQFQNLGVGEDLTVGVTAEARQVQHYPYENVQEVVRNRDFNKSIASRIRFQTSGEGNR